MLQPRLTQHVYTDSTPLTQYAAVFKEFRVARRLSQAWIAKVVGVSSGYISRVEKGTRRPSVKLHNLIVDAMKLDSESRARLWNAFALGDDPLAALPPAAREIIVALIDCHRPDTDISEATLYAIRHILASDGAWIAIPTDDELDVDAPMSI